MNKKFKLLFWLIFSFFLFQTLANAKSTFQCEYTVPHYALASTRGGKLTCTMGSDSFLWFKNSILDCTWRVDDKMDVWVIEHGTENFDVSDYLKNGGTDCPSYISIETSSPSYENGGIFKDGVNAYFSNELSDVQNIKGAYYNVGDLDGLENSQLSDLYCNSGDEEYYDDLFVKFQNQIDLFYEDKCDEFKLSDEENQNGVAFPETFKRHKKCDGYLNFAESYFNTEIAELKSLYSEYQCFDKNTYDLFSNKLTFYQGQYKSLKNKLDEAFTTKSDDPSGGIAPPIDDPDYNVTDDASIENTCSSPSFRKPMKFIGVILNFIKIIVPILIIVFGVVDLYKAVTASKDDGLKKALKSIAIRVLAGVFIFLLPGIIQFILNMVNEWSDYKNVWCCCTDCLLNPDCDVSSCSSNSCHIEGTNQK